MPNSPNKLEKALHEQIQGLLPLNNPYLNQFFFLLEGKKLTLYSPNRFVSSSIRELYLSKLGLCAKDFLEKKGINLNGDEIQIVDDDPIKYKSLIKKFPKKSRPKSPEEHHPQKSGRKEGGPLTIGNLTPSKIIPHVGIQEPYDYIQAICRGYTKESAVFIGRAGTGKTTLINYLYNLLTKKESSPVGLIDLNTLSQTYRIAINAQKKGEGGMIDSLQNKLTELLKKDLILFDEVRTLVGEKHQRDGCQNVLYDHLGTALEKKKTIICAFTGNEPSWVEFTEKIKKESLGERLRWLKRIHTSNPPLEERKPLLEKIIYEHFGGEIDAPKIAEEIDREILGTDYSMWDIRRIIDGLNEGYQKPLFPRLQGFKSTIQKKDLPERTKRQQILEVVSKMYGRSEGTILKPGSRNEKTRTARGALAYALFIEDSIPLEEIGKILGVSETTAEELFKIYSSNLKEKGELRRKIAGIEN